MDELTGQVVVKIPANTFDGVPEDTTVTIFIPGIKKPLIGMLGDISIAKPEPVYTAPVATYTFGTFLEAFDEAALVTLPMTPQVDGTVLLNELVAAIPGLKGIKAGCPEKVCFAYTVQGPLTAPDFPVIDIVMHLNDHHRWSREQIASWLEEQDWDLQFATPEGETA